MIVEPINSRTSSYYSFFLMEKFIVIVVINALCTRKKSRRFNHWRLLGVEKYSSEIMEENGGDFSKRKGVSCLLVNTNRGNEILEKYGEFINKVPVDIEK